MTKGPPPTEIPADAAQRIVRLREALMAAKHAAADAFEARDQRVIEALLGRGITSAEVAAATGMTSQGADKLLRRVRTRAGIPRGASPERMAAITATQETLDAARARVGRAHAELRELIQRTEPMSHPALARLLGGDIELARRLRTRPGARTRHIHSRMS